MHIAQTDVSQILLAACAAEVIYLTRSTRGLMPCGSGAGSAIAPLFDLAPDGVCLAPGITVGPVVSYTAFSPLPSPGFPQGRRFVSVALSIDAGIAAPFQP